MDDARSAPGTRSKFRKLLIISAVLVIGFAFGWVVHSKYGTKLTTVEIESRVTQKLGPKAASARCRPTRAASDVYTCSVVATEGGDTTVRVGLTDSGRKISVETPYPPVGWK